MAIGRIAMIVGLLCTASTVSGAETITYTYDAKGRLVKVVRSGSVNNGRQVEYQHDKADNRIRVKAN